MTAKNEYFFATTGYTFLGYYKNPKPRDRGWAVEFHGPYYTAVQVKRAAEVFYESRIASLQQELERSQEFTCAEIRKGE